MNRGDLIRRVRSLTRDFSNSIFREVDIVDYINEAVNRCKQIIPELQGMKELTSNDVSPILLPNEYHSLLAVYSASRCFGQDERHYQSSNFMNEFEVKMDELKSKIEDGTIVIVDSNGDTVSSTLENDYVVDVYFDKTKTTYLEEG
jgi:hypothetical protein